MQGIMGRIEVLDHGFVELLDMMPRSEPLPIELRGKQLTEQEYAILTAARTSTGGEIKGFEKDIGLLKYLLNNRHTTPVEMVEIKFRTQVPMDCWRQWIRHRMSTTNEYSTRYSEAIEDVYVPEVFGYQGGSGTSRQASGEPIGEWEAKWIYGSRPDNGGTEHWRTNRDTFEVVYVESESETAAQWLERTRRGAIAVAKEQYREELMIGVAKETARGIIPITNYTLAVWKIDLWNLLHFFGLRIHPHAQGEIKAYGQAMWDLIYPYMPHLLDHFKDLRLDGISLSGSELRAMVETVQASGQLPAKLLTAYERLKNKS